MRVHMRVLMTVAGVVAGTTFVLGQSPGYKMTVSRDRLVNATNEPQNWLIMNGDFGALAIRSCRRSIVTT